MFLASFPQRSRNEKMQAKRQPSAQDLDDTRQSVVGDRRPLAWFARSFGLHELTLYRRANEARLPYVKIARTRYYDPDDIKKLLARKCDGTPRPVGRPRRDREDEELANAAA